MWNEIWMEMELRCERVTRQPSAWFSAFMSFLLGRLHTQKMQNKNMIVFKLSYQWCYETETSLTISPLYLFHYTIFERALGNNKVLIKWYDETLIRTQRLSANMKRGMCSIYFGTKVNPLYWVTKYARKFSSEERNTHTTFLRKQQHSQPPPPRLRQSEM